MNKSKLKKKIESNNLETLINKCSFIGFFCMQNIAVADKLQLKKSLDRHGFKYKLIKNSAVFKTLFKSAPSMKGLISGSLAICYTNKDIPNRTDFISLKEVFSIIKKEKNVFFLGGFFEGSLVNALFEKKVSSLKDLSLINIEQISLTQSILTNIIRTTSNSKNQLSFVLSNKVD